MKIGIHVDEYYDKGHAMKCREYLVKQGVEIKKLNLLAPDALDQVKDCDGVVWRWEHNPDHKQSAQKILFAIEYYFGIPVFPNCDTAWHFDEKIYQYYVLQALNAPVPDTWLFWNQQEAYKWLETASIPIIFKLSSGAGSSNILKIESKESAALLIDQQFREGIYPYTMNEYASSINLKNLKNCRNLFERFYGGLNYIITGRYPGLQSKYWKLERSYIYFQEFLPNNEYDTRITIIGEYAFAFRRFNRKNDFRASGSGIIDYSIDQIDKSMIEIAFQISQKGKFQSMSYDFLYQKQKPVICEISYTFSDIAIYNCPGHWNKNMEWISGNVWPEYLQMEVFMAQVDKKK